MQNERVKPDYCKEICRNCEISSLLRSHEDIRKLTQAEIILELSRHGHPKSRKMESGFQRVTSEGRDELIAHFTFAHGITY